MFTSSERGRKVNIRREARGRACTVRLAGCDGGGDTTCLAHYRLSGLCGMGQKPDDAIGAFACFSCHNIIDYRAKTPAGMTRDDVRLAHAEACLRTISILRKEGKL